MFKRTSKTSIIKNINIIIIIIMMGVFVATSYLITQHSRSKPNSQDSTISLFQLSENIQLIVSSYLIALEESTEKLTTDFASSLSNKCLLDPTQTMQIGSFTVPRAYLDNEPVDNNKHADEFTKNTGAAVSIFSYQKGEFLRISTSLRDTQGQRLISPSLNHNHPAWYRLRQGGAYTGHETFFNETYISRYQPIMNPSGEMIGAVALSVNVSTGLNNLFKKIKTLPLQDHEAFAIIKINTNDDQSFGTPLLETKNFNSSLLHDKDEHQQSLLLRLYRQPDGPQLYRLHDTRQHYYFATSHIENSNWLVVSRNTVPTQLTQVSKINLLLICSGGTLFLLLLMILLINHYLGLKKPLQHLQTIIDQIREGDFRTDDPLTERKDPVGLLFNDVLKLKHELKYLLSDINHNIEDIVCETYTLSEKTESMIKAITSDQSKARRTLTNLKNTLHNIANNHNYLKTIEISIDKIRHYHDNEDTHLLSTETYDNLMQIMSYNSNALERLQQTYQKSTIIKLKPTLTKPFLLTHMNIKGDASLNIDALIDEANHLAILTINTIDDVSQHFIQFQHMLTQPLIDIQKTEQTSKPYTPKSSCQQLKKQKNQDSVVQSAMTELDTELSKQKTIIHHLIIDINEISEFLIHQNINIKPNKITKNIEQLSNELRKKMDQFKY